MGPRPLSLQKVLLCFTVLPINFLVSSDFCCAADNYWNCFHAGAECFRRWVKLDLICEGIMQILTVGQLTCRHHAAIWQYATIDRKHWKASKNTNGPLITDNKQASNPKPFTHAQCTIRDSFESPRGVQSVICAAYSERRADCEPG